MGTDSKVFYSNASSAPIDQVHQEVFFEELLARWCAFTHGDASELPLGAGTDRPIGSYQFS